MATPESRTRGTPWPILRLLPTPPRPRRRVLSTAASPAVAHGLIDTGVGTLAPAELITQSAPPRTESDPIEIGPQSPDTSPEVG